MLFIQRRSALLTNSHLAIATHFMSDPHRTARRTHQRHVRQPNRPLLLGNSTLDVALRIRTHVLLHRHHMLHQHLALVGKYAQYASFFSRIPPGHHLHGVIPADIHSFVFGGSFSHRRTPSASRPVETGFAPSQPRQAAFLPSAKVLPAPAIQSSK